MIIELNNFCSYVLMLKKSGDRNKRTNDWQKNKKGSGVLIVDYSDSKNMFVLLLKIGIVFHWSGYR